MADGIRETTRKVEVSLLSAIEQYLQDHSATTNPGLDFLDTKNTLLLSYLIDLVVYLRNRISKQNDNPDNLQRLTEMKVALDKLRVLDKKLRYQIDKLLAGATSSTSFVAAETTNNSRSSNLYAAAAAAVEEDPLDYRPNADALDDDDEGASSREGVDDADESSREGEKDEEESTDGSNARGKVEGSDEDEEQAGAEDLDKAAARMSLTREKKSNKEETSLSSPGMNSNLYRAPRLAAVPYNDNNKLDKQVEREKRQRRRLKASEIALTLRSQLGDAPEQEDVHGGAELGRQREAARRLSEMEKEKIKYEEEAMVRLTRTRMEKKQQKRLMRQETSNLSAIADLGNLVRGLESSTSRERRPPKADDGFEEDGRYGNGKRKRQGVDKHGRATGVNKNRSFKSKNSLQTALYGQGGGKGKKNKK